MSDEYEVFGDSAMAPFRLKVHRGDGAVLLAMDWRNGQPPNDFAGFAIEYSEPGGDRFYAIKNRLSFPKADGSVDRESLSSLLAPIQLFRWAHFPRNAAKPGLFTYRVTPLFMNTKDELSQGEPQTVRLDLRRETHPGVLNVAFTRGYVSSQAFNDMFGKGGKFGSLIPVEAKDGLSFDANRADKDAALQWMGGEAREEILAVLDRASSDKFARVRVIAYDLNEPHVVDRLVALGDRLEIIIDDSDEHAKTGSAENSAEQRLKAAHAIVKRQHMDKLQHNKVIIVDGTDEKTVVCGSTNFTWRGLYVQANNAVILKGEKAVKVFGDAFETYWNKETATAKAFGKTEAAEWKPVGSGGVDMRVTFSPHSDRNAALADIAKDMKGTQSSLFFALAFLYQTEGPVRQAVTDVANSDDIYVYGISDQEIGGIDLQKPNGIVGELHPDALDQNVPEPFTKEQLGGRGRTLHHKFVVIDFDKPDARVYTGSYNFSGAADTKNGENLLLIRDRKVAVAYMIEALRLCDHYAFRVAHDKAKEDGKALALARPPRKDGEQPWWKRFYTEPRKIKERKLFAGV